MAAAVTSREDRSALTLRFHNKRVEREYMRFLHPQTSATLPFGFLALAVVFGLVELTQPSLMFEYAFLWWIIATAVLFINHVVFKLGQRESLRAGTLTVERWVLVITLIFQCGFVTVGDLYYLRECDGDPATLKRSGSKVHDNAMCERWIDAMIIAILATLAALRIAPFWMVATTGGCSFLVSATAWLVVSPPDVYLNVVLPVIFIGAGTLFVLFFSRENEDSHRDIFRSHLALLEYQQFLVETEAALADYCKAMLPASLLARLHDVDAATAVDKTSEGVVILLGVDNFDVFCTSFDPLRVVSQVGMLHAKARQVYNRHDIDVVGVLGDLLVGASNLIQNHPHAERAACKAAASLLHERHTEAPVNITINTGPLRGGFSGTLFIRYSISGSCYDEALKMRHFCEAECAVLPHAMLRRVQKLTGQYSNDSSSSSKRTVTTRDVEIYYDSREGGRGGLPFPSSPHVHAAGAPEDVSFESADHQPLLPRRSPQVLSPAQISEPGSETTEVEASAFVIDDLTWCLGQELQSINVALERNESLLNAVRRTLMSQRRQSSSPNSEEATLILSRMDNAVDALRADFERHQVRSKDWCCFERFQDPALEASFLRQEVLIASTTGRRAWLAYAGFVSVLLLLLLLDLQGPRAIYAALVLLLSVLVCIALATIPALLGVERFHQFYVGWSAVGFIVPILVVYGCALSRPSAVGNDPGLLSVVATLIRTYCFGLTRRRALLVPPALLAAYSQYLFIPGGFVSPAAVLVVIVVVTYLMLSETQRERDDREQLSRNAEVQFVMGQLRSLERLRSGVLRSWPPSVVAFADSSLKQRMGTGIEHTATQTPDATVLMVRATTQQSSSAEGGFDQFRVLETALESTPMLSPVSVMGDLALIVGPVSLQSPSSPQDVNESLCQAVDFGLKLLVKAPHLSTLIDVDTVIHFVSLSTFAQYSVLGVAVTRLLSIVAGATMAGCVATERVVRMAKELITGVEVTLLGPMKIRGAGMIRLSSLKPSADTPLVKEP